MSKNKTYWKGIEELAETPEFVKARENEFVETLPIDGVLGDAGLNETKTNRRDFLKFLGFSATAATLAACEAPVRKSIPYLFKPEEITPGVANYYASTFYDGNDYASVLVKTREGRPIKIEANSLCPISGSGSHARVQASVLSLYDSGRLAQPLKAGAATDWKTIDSEITSKLAAIQNAGGAIRILTSSIISPSIKKTIEAFAAKYPNTKWVQYDAISYSGIIDANAETFGVAHLPTYRFDKAEVIVSIGADFLANWISPIEHSSQYASTRKVNAENKKMSRHIQIESLLTVTGGNADLRVPVKPSKIGNVAIRLLNKLTGQLTAASTEKDDKIDAIAKELKANKGKALVVCGSNDKNIQKVVNAINVALESYGNTIDLTTPDLTKQGRDSEVNALISEINSGKVAALIIHNANPVYTLPNGEAFKAALAKVDLTISTADRADETASNCKFVAPDNHYLESWGDQMPRAGVYTMTQPTINPLFDTRQFIESLSVWSGNPAKAEDIVAKTSESEIFSKASSGLSFSSFWTKSLHDGVVTFIPEVKTQPAFDGSSLQQAAQEINSQYSKTGTFELVTYQKTGLGNGNQANNPWLHELPDPISKVTWDNYVIMNPSQMKELGLEIINSQERPMSVVEVKVGNTSFKLAAYPQPGLPVGVIGVALGYGRTHAGKTANGIGFNAFSLVRYGNSNFIYEALSADVTKTSETYFLAATQTHHTMMGRAIVKEATLTEYKKNPKAGNETILLATNIKEIEITNENGKKGARPKDVTLWNEFKNNNHFWNMVIDLNVCFGCGACVISCNAENNVPVVGKDEVRRSREMHWMRIDRYYSSDMNEEKAKEEKLGAIEKFAKMEIPSEADSLQVVFQPVMCQHCNHAPCETVCPVLATTHSLEGLNQMTYNRCIGTRYCANNCPYKVRRFNWFRYNENDQFDFYMNDDLGKMVLNPDVTVRSRGVMEKCSMCVQRIQEGKLAAKKQGIRPKDGSIKTACQQACPTNAITFGDYNDENSQLRKVYSDERRYQLLEEIGVQPSVHYLTKIRNSENINA
jgi:molybdopterin-containing oxidoreductase family iron-sulfur binding subunit